jgi:hypothetical protein
MWLTQAIDGGAEIVGTSNLVSLVESLTPIREMINNQLTLMGQND